MRAPARRTYLEWKVTEYDGDSEAVKIGDMLDVVWDGGITEALTQCVHVHQWAQWFQLCQVLVKIVNALDEKWFGMELKH
jgi:hypothetical protein